jgi:peptide/nickel transport system permease protein
LGLDGSLPTQYARWLGDIARGDLGISWTNRLPVAERMLPRIAMSLELAY